MKGQVDIELQRLIRARYNTAVENWSEWKWGDAANLLI